MATKKYQLGFDLWAMLLFLATMIPTFIWYAIPAPNDILRADSATPIIDTVGAILQPLFVILLCFVKRIDSTAKSPIIPMVATIFYCLIV